MLIIVFPAVDKTSAVLATGCYANKMTSLVY